MLQRQTEQLGWLKTPQVPPDFELNSQTFFTDLQTDVKKQITAELTLMTFRILPVPNYHLADFQLHNEQFNTMD